MRLGMMFGVAVAGALWAQDPYVSFTSYSVPAFPPQTGPYGIISGADEALWLEGRSSVMARVTTDGTVTSYPIPASQWWGAGRMTAGPDGATWFTEYGVNKIGRITTNGEVAEYDIPAPAGAIAAGPDGALWFSEGTKLGRLTTTGEVTEYPVQNCAGVVSPGPDGALWFIESTACGNVVNGTTTINVIGRITTDGTITEYPLPATISYQGVWNIVAGPDGAMWFNEYYAGKIGRITLDGVVTEYPLGSAGSGAGPTAITAGPDGALWFPESNDDSFFHTLGRITTDGIVTEFDVPVLNINYSAVITTGSDGALWFTDGWTSNVIRAALRPGFAIASGLMPYGRAGNTYSTTLAAHGGTLPYTWTITGGSLPDGLSIDPAKGVIAGTPASSGVANFTVQVTDSGNPSQSATQALRILIVP